MCAVEVRSDGSRSKIRESLDFADNLSVTSPLISVIIPTRERQTQLEACLSRLGRQRTDRTFEVLIALDGPDSKSESVARVHCESGLDITIVEAARLGIAEAKNRAIERARGDILLLINDDVLPAQDFIAAHAEAHESRPDLALVVGWSPWVAPAHDSLFSRALRETSMVFFYDRMITPAGVPLREKEHDWGFRHAWNLNLSLDRALAESVGGFRPALANCCYEDVEFAYRATRLEGDTPSIPVLFEARARADHDHAYTPEGYLEREFRLGYSAYGFAVCAPEAALAVFGRDVASREEHAYLQAFLERESGRETAILGLFQRLSTLPSDIGGAGVEGKWAVELAYTQHLLLKRLAFARGLIAGFDGVPIPGLFHPRDGLETSPGLRVGSAESGGRRQKTSGKIE